MGQTGVIFSFNQKTLKNSHGNPSTPGVLLFFIFFNAAMSSDIFKGPSNDGASDSDSLVIG